MLTNKARKKVLSKFMDKIATQSWHQVDLPELATECGVKYSALRGNYSGKLAILSDFMTMIDQETLDNIESNENEESTAKDRLFDILMARLDALEPYRDSIQQLLCAVKSDPCLALTLNKYSVRSMRWMLEGAKVETRGMTGNAKIQGLVVLFSRIVCIWLKDEDKGLSKTMAALDAELNRGHILLKQVELAENLVSNLCRLVCSPIKRACATPSSNQVPA